MPNKDPPSDDSKTKLADQELAKARVGLSEDAYLKPADIDGENAEKRKPEADDSRATPCTSCSSASSIVSGFF